MPIAERRFTMEGLQESMNEAKELLELAPIKKYTRDLEECERIIRKAQLDHEYSRLIWVCLERVITSLLRRNARKKIPDKDLAKFLKNRAYLKKPQKGRHEGLGSCIKLLKDYLDMLFNDEKAPASTVDAKIAPSEEDTSFTKPKSVEAKSQPGDYRSRLDGTQTNPRKLGDDPFL
ncbi:hypothetical protein PG984_005767 [Apiospora sp. TS-2023a]